MGEGGGSLDLKSILDNNYSGCLYFFNILSYPAVIIYPVGRLLIKYCSGSVLIPYKSQVSSNYFPLFLVGIAVGPFIITIP